MKYVQIALSDDLARDAEAAGLLEPRVLEKMIAEAVRRRAAGRLLAVGRRTLKAGVQALSMEDVQAEVAAVRSARRVRRASLR